MNKNLANHPVYKQLVNKLKKHDFQKTRLLTTKDIILHTTDQLHEKPLIEVKNGY